MLLLFKEELSVCKCFLKRFELSQYISNTNVCNTSKAMKTSFFIVKTAFSSSLSKEELLGKKFYMIQNLFLCVFAGALACCNGDTWASELGSVLSFGDPVLITNLHPVPKGNVNSYLSHNRGISVFPYIKVKYSSSVSCLEITHHMH